MNNVRFKIWIGHLWESVVKETRDLPKIQRLQILQPAEEESLVLAFYTLKQFISQEGFTEDCKNLDWNLN